MITLEKELEHASSYLAIQNIRFKDKFEFHVDADPELLKYFCPKLSIQPLLAAFQCQIFKILAT